jgi:hypothetical protein
MDLILLKDWEGRWGARGMIMRRARLEGKRLKMLPICHERENSHWLNAFAGPAIPRKTCTKPLKGRYSLAASRPY